MANKEKISRILVRVTSFALILLALPLTVFLIFQTQDIRQRASSTEDLWQSKTPQKTKNGTTIQVQPNTTTNEILVKFKSSTSESTKTAVYSAAGTVYVRTVQKVDVQVVSVPESSVDIAIQRYKSNPNIEFAERNGILTAVKNTNDARLSEQWGMSAVHAAGNAQSAWDTSAGIPSVKIAVVDCGIYEEGSSLQNGWPGHPDINGKVAARKDFTGSTTGSDDYCDHGTHVAGIAASTTNNGIGVAGVGYNSSLINAKVLNDGGSGFFDEVAEGIIWSADQGAHVINMSLGASGECPATLQSAIDYAWSKNAVIIAAAGNSGSSAIISPASCRNVIAVASTNQSDSKSGFSSYGTWVHVAAPGSYILSTDYIGEYVYKSGTSMAAPHVAGLAGLIWGQGKCTTNSCIRDAIFSSSDKIAGTGTYWQYGRINALKALTENACLRKSPNITISPSSQDGHSGKRLQYVITITNLDDTSCTPSIFEISLPNTDQWNYDPDRILVRIDPGKSESKTIVIASPQNTPAGIYTRNVVAKNISIQSGDYSTTALFTYIVNNPPAPIIDSTGVVTSYNPWAVWVKGRNLRPELKVFLYDQNEPVRWGWGTEIPVVFGADGVTLTFQVPSNVPPSGCNIGKNCKINIRLAYPNSNVVSNLYSITLPSSQNYGAIYGRVYKDFNKNGTKDANEPPLSGAVMSLEEQSPGGFFVGREHQTVQLNGEFTYGNLPQNNYRLSVISPNGYKETTPRIITLNNLLGSTVQNFGAIPPASGYVTAYPNPCTINADESLCITKVSGIFQYAGSSEICVGSSSFLGGFVENQIFSADAPWIQANTNYTFSIKTPPANCTGTQLDQITVNAIKITPSPTPTPTRAPTPTATPIPTNTPIPTSTPTPTRTPTPTQIPTSTPVPISCSTFTSNLTLTSFTGNTSVSGPGTVNSIKWYLDGTLKGTTGASTKTYNFANLVASSLHYLRSEIIYNFTQLKDCGTIQVLLPSVTTTFARPAENALLPQNIEVKGASTKSITSINVYLGYGQANQKLLKTCVNTISCLFYYTPTSDIATGTHILTAIVNNSEGKTATATRTVRK